MNLFYSTAAEAYILSDGIQDHVLSEEEMIDMYGESDVAISWIATAFKNPNRTVTLEIEP